MRFVCLLLTLFALTGCGGGNGNSPEPADGLTFTGELVEGIDGEFCFFITPLTERCECEPVPDYWILTSGDFTLYILDSDLPREFDEFDTIFLTWEEIDEFSYIEPPFVVCDNDNGHHGHDDHEDKPDNHGHRHDND